VRRLPWWGLAVLLTAWSGGIMAAELLGPLGLWLIATIAIAVAVACIRRDLALLSALALLAFLLGAGRAAVAPSVQLPSGIAGQKVAVAGTVDDDLVARKTSTRVVVRLDHILTSVGQEPSSLRIEATIYGAIPIHYGDLVLLSGTLEQAPVFEQFDYRGYLAEQGISAVMPSAKLVRVTAHRGDPLHEVLFTVRHALIDAVDRSLPEPQAALLLGVVFGYRAALPPALQQQMIASGLIHIVVISGLKVSLLARIIHQALGRFLPAAAPMIALGAMAGYALLAGASAAALRAATMGALVVIAGRLRRDSQVYVSLALTAAVMLGIKPALAGDVSFELSFAGTIGIASLTDGIARRLGWIPSLLRDPFAATIAAESATWPLMLANFHQLSIVAPVANALVLPLLPVMMVVGGGGALIATLLSAAGWPAIQASGAIASWYRVLIESLGSLPVAAITAPYFPARWLAAASLINGGALVGIKLRYFFWQRKVWAVLAAAGLLAIALLLVRPDGRVHVYALDVGTGSAVLVRTAGGSQVLLDGGPDPDKLAQAIGRALPPTAREINLWIITGGRRQQIGAGMSVLQRFQVDRLVVSDPDPWTVTLRNVVEQANRSGVATTIGAVPVVVDGALFQPASDSRTWVIRAGSASLAVIPADSDWHGSPPQFPRAIFTKGGPADWDPVAAPCLAVIQVSPRRVDGLPNRNFLDAVNACQILRPDQIGNVELAADDSTFLPVN
jgi:competence protein ComEC